MTGTHAGRRIHVENASQARNVDDVYIGPGSSYANPFEPYVHCAGPDGDWGVHDTGRFTMPIAHGWSERGARRFAVDCYRKTFDEHFPHGSSVRKHIALQLRGRDLACTCPDGEPCHGDYLLEVGREGGSALVDHVEERSA